MDNRLCNTFGLRYPLCLAGMGMISTAELVAAVSNAGGLGVLGAGPAPIPWVRATIERIRELTPRPFGVNLIHETSAFGPLTTDEHIELCVEMGLDLVVFFWQAPAARWIEMLLRAGVPFWVTADSEDAIARAAILPCSGIVVQGMEAGGHVRALRPVSELVPVARGTSPDRIVVAAGGVATAADVRRLLDCGADGVSLGTRFVASVEANVHPEYQRRIVAARGTDTVVTTIFGPEWPDAPMRVIANRATAGELAAASVGTTTLFGQSYELPPASAVLPSRTTDADFDQLCLAAGTSVEHIRDVRPAGEIVHGLFHGWWPT